MDVGEPHRPEVRRTGQHMLDMVTSVCALMISAISIFMAWDNGRDMQKLVHANSWPVLEVGSGNSGKGEFEISFTVKNAGVGPARIHTFAFFVDRKKIRAEFWLSGIAELCCSSEWTSALRQMGGDKRQALGPDFSTPIALTFFSPNEEEMPIRWPRTENNQALWKAVDKARQQGRIAMRVCYCSVFDECWIADQESFPPRPVASCPNHF